MSDPIVNTLFSKEERVTGGVPVITTDHALIHDGGAFSLAGTMTVATAKTGGLFLTAPDDVAAAATINMTNATADLTYTAVAVGPDGNSISVAHLDPQMASQTLEVVVQGFAVEVYLATDESEAIISTAAEVKAAVNAHAAAALLVACEDEGAGSGVVNAVAATYLTGGADKKYVHFKGAAIRSTAVVTASLMEGYTPDPGNTVSTLTPANRHRNSSNAATMACVGGTDVTPTQGTGYATLATAAIGANLAPAKVGGEISQAEEWVLAPGESYCLAIANASGGNAVVSYELFWVEKSAA